MADTICEITLKDEPVRRALREIVDKSYDSKREIGATICGIPSGGVTISNMCIGDACSIRTRDKCEHEHKVIGSLHTHPNGNQLFSKNDIRNLIMMDSKKSCTLTKNTLGKYMLSCFEVNEDKYPSQIKGKTFSSIADLYNEDVKSFNSAVNMFRAQRDTGMISSEEYIRKRQDVLSSFNSNNAERKNLIDVFNNFAGLYSHKEQLGLLAGLCAHEIK